MKIFLLPNDTKPSATKVAEASIEILRREQTEVFLGSESSFGAALAQKCGAVCMPEQDALNACDVVLSIGGDGTMLHAARKTMHYGKPLVGINTGRLGFLTSIEGHELEKLRRLPRGEYTVENRTMLCADILDDQQQACLALNDIVLFKQQPEKTVSLEIYCDDILVSRVRGDGVIFATPTGSTAYSMSAGGPIVDAHMGGIIVTQICAHILQTPPMVFAGKRKLRVVSTGFDDSERAYVSCDGMRSTLLAVNQSIEITQASYTVPLVQFQDAGQLKSIDKKLKGR